MSDFISAFKVQLIAAGVAFAIYCAALKISEKK